MFTGPGASARALVPATSSSTASAIIAAATSLLPLVERGQRLGSRDLRAVMEAAFGASDADGAWDWKAAYEACEVAQILFLRKYAATLLAARPDEYAVLNRLEKLARLFPTQSRRSLESVRLQQFSTPLSLAYAASVAACLTPDDVVLEPSAGTGLLAAFARAARARLHLNELADARAALLEALFESAPVTRHDAAHIDDLLAPDVIPSVVLMNPPFSAMAHVDMRAPDAAMRHIGSALARLAPGGRLVAITGANFHPHHPRWGDAFDRIQEHARVALTFAVHGSVFAAHGTSVDVRLTVIDKRPADHPTAYPPEPPMPRDSAALLAHLIDCVPNRLRVARATTSAVAAAQPTNSLPRRPLPAIAPRPELEAVELAYEAVGRSADDTARISDSLYEDYCLQSLIIPGAAAHPTKLVQSAAMASVVPPRPSYRPHVLHGHLAQGVLSGPQFESVIYAGEAHAGHLAGAWTVDATYDRIEAAPDGCDNAVRFRRGWFLGDGTGAGKGRQVAGIILDNWLKGRRRALWISKSDKLIEDARRDWSALGQERLLVTPLSRFAQGTPIRLQEGILFATYATLRSEGRAGKLSRFEQIVEWLGHEFDGVIVFDESHAMQNAAGGTGERGDCAPSQQGRAGLRLQHALADARIVYVSATGATGVQNLAYAQRLGLWGGEDFPFANRADFVSAIESGGVAAMEVLARDLKALGLYAARSLSYEGVEYEIVEHELTVEQTRIYDAYAAAFQVIHNNLDAALEVTNVTGSQGTLNAQARSVARSAFEGAKQRFFNHLITAMKTPTLIASIERDLAAGHSCVVQIVSTGEALMERRLAEIDPAEWDDLRIDITPREYVLDYLANSFPVQLFEPFTDAEGNLCSRPMVIDGQPVICREAVARRDRMIDGLAALEPVQGALDQIVLRFGTDTVAEVTGRSRRIVRKADRLQLQSRPANANLAEAQAFMDDDKRVLVFSDAGGTGRSYHADLGARNQRLRVHYLLEAGWKADTAIQGLGRTNRTNQAQPPLFRPIATNVKAEKRFLSTIARRLDTLGAITRGQRETGGQGMFRAGDNLESQYARDALRQLYRLIHAGRLDGCSLGTFESQTGLSLTDAAGCLKDELPPITTFLNRLLALTIAMQNRIFESFEALLEAKVASAIAGGTFEIGLETLTAESFRIVGSATVYEHPGTGAETRLLTIARKDRNRPRTLAEALEWLEEPHTRLLVNARSKRAAVQIPASSVMLDDGSVEKRVQLIRPMDRLNIARATMPETHWEEADEAQFQECWEAEVAAVPEFDTSELHLVTGLLLPIWKRLPNELTRVYRLATDDGERIVGRKVSSAWAAQALASGAPTLLPGDALALLRDGKAVIELAEGLALRRALVMHRPRIELTGFAEPALDRLKALGLISEIISWKLRLFVPLGDDAVRIVAKLFERYPIARIADRMAA
ncbi:MAG: strawberry notch family protein [Novosphingobium sp.]|nr:strawberry notch family protein [Novosphingobium sp.]